MTPVNDFYLYWVTAKALLHHQNPYAPVAGYTLVSLLHPGELVVPFNPPWALPLMLWLGWLPLRAAEFAWLLLSIVLVSVSGKWLAELYLPEIKPTWAQALAFVFLPTLTLFLLGQSTAWTLFGLAGFLGYQEKRPYLGGAFLFFVTVKPHLVFLVWPALVLYALRGYWKPLVGFFGTIATASLVMVAVRPSIFGDYFRMLTEYRVGNYGAPTLATYLRQATGSALVQQLPILLAVVWFGWYWLRSTKAGWQWKDRLPALLVVSVAATPYGWFFDQVVLLPAVFSVAGELARLGRRRLIAVLAFAAINFSTVALLVLHKTLLWQSAWHTCTASAWLVLYWVVTRELLEERERLHQ